jgi:hypothetical protein
MEGKTHDISDLGFPLAYFETRFKLDAPVDHWPKQFAIITAYATTGQNWPEQVNKGADEKLAADIKASGNWYRRITGYSPFSGHSEPGWAVEMSFLDACNLGFRYLQDAIYYIDGDILLATHCQHNRRELFQVGPSFRQRLDAGSNDQAAPS